MSKSSLSLTDSKSANACPTDARYSTSLDRAVNNVSRENAVSEHIGYEVIGPLCYGFVRWLVVKAQDTGVQHLYFLSRDGWLLKEAFDRLSPEVRGNLKTHYLYSSRRAVWFAALDENTPENEFYEMLSGASPHVPVRGYLERIFLDPEHYKAQIIGAGFNSEHDVVTSPSDREKLYRLFRNIKPAIVEKAREEREAYLAYLEDEGLFAYNRAGLVDVGWTGSIVKYTRNLVGRVKPELDLHAYFIGVGGKAQSKYGFRKGDCLHGYLFDFDDKTHAEIRKGFFVVEKFLSPNEPSLIKMTRTGGKFKPVYKEGPREESPMNKIVQKAALQFVRDNANEHKPFDSARFLPALKKLIAAPSAEVARELSQYSYSSDFGYQVKPSLIAYSQNGGQYLRHPLHLFRDYRRARWKAGFIAQQPLMARLVLQVVRKTALDQRYDQFLRWARR
jgi:hypothetical protein